MENEKHFINDKPFESKMIILLLIQKMGLPMPLSRIQTFIFSTSFMDYFALSEYMSDLIETGHLEITDEKCVNEHTYKLTEQGEEAIEYFKGHISDYAKMKIAEYVKESKPQLRDRLSVYSSYKALDVDSFDAVCGAKEGNKTVFEVKINVSSKKYAQQICDRWKDSCSELYMSFMNRMMGDNGNSTDNVLL